MRFKERGAKWTLFKTGSMLVVCAEEEPTEEYRVICRRGSSSLIKLDNKSRSGNGIRVDGQVKENEWYLGLIFLATC